VGLLDERHALRNAFEALGVEEIVISPWVLPFAVHEPAILDVISERVIAPLAASA
jgi:hypothetical protein